MTVDGSEDREGKEAGLLRLVIVWLTTARVIYINFHLFFINDFE
jgi:hypothetical protein